MYDDNVSSKRHGGGSFHGVLRRGSRHGGSKHGSRHGRQYSRHGSSKSSRNGGSKHGRSRKQRQQSQQKSSYDLPPLGRGNAHTNHAGKPEANDATHDNTEGSTGSFSGGGTHGSARTRGKAARGRSLLSLSISPGGVRAMKAIDGVKSDANGRVVPNTGVARLAKGDAVYSSTKATAREGYLHGETKAEVEVEREAEASKEGRLEVQRDENPDNGADRDIETAGGHAAASCPSEMKMASTGCMESERHEVGESTLAPTEDFIAPTEESTAPTEESVAPTEESMAPTEESMAPTEEEGTMTTTKATGIGIAPAEESSIGIPIIDRETRRPSLRSLKNRLNQQEHLDLDFSSNDEDDLEVEDVSSSDDEQVSQPARSPARSSSDSTGANTLYGYRDFSLPTPKLPAAKQASDELSSLMAFDLPVEALQDKVIESYSSALYTGGGLPLHGRLYVTKKYALFSGWRNTKVILPLSEVVRVEKTSTLMMVINALTLVKRDGERINFGAFLYRDDCYNLLTRLVKVSSSISRLRGASDDVDGTLTDASPVPRSDSDDETENGDVSSEPPETARGVAIERSLAPSLSQSGGKQLEALVEAVLPCTVAQVFSWLWGRDTTFWSDFLRAQGETGLSISRWRKGYHQSAAEGSDGDGRGLKKLFPGETFHGQRQLTFTHPRTGFVVGPRQVLTRQSQGYRLERRQNLLESVLSSPVDRLVLCQTTQMERGAPLADHFTILGKLMVTREPPSIDGQPRCRLEIGFDVAFHKSTMLRGAIRSGALEETNATWRTWLATSRKVIAYQRHHLGGTAANNGVASAPPEGVHDLAQGFALVDRSSDAVEPGQGKDDEESLAAIEMESTKERKIDELGISKFVSGVIRVIRVLRGFAVKTIDSFGVAAALTMLLCMLFLLMLGLQQRDLRRLKDQVEELVGTVRELRDRIDEGREGGALTH